MRETVMAISPLAAVLYFVAFPAQLVQWWLGSIHSSDRLGRRSLSCVGDPAGWSGPRCPARRELKQRPGAVSSAVTGAVSSNP